MSAILDVIDAAWRFSPSIHRDAQAEAARAEYAELVAALLIAERNLRMLGVALPNVADRNSDVTREHILNEWVVALNASADCARAVLAKHGGAT